MFRCISGWANERSINYHSKVPATFFEPRKSPSLAAPKDIPGGISDGMGNSSRHADCHRVIAKVKPRQVGSPHAHDTSVDLSLRRPKRFGNYRILADTIAPEHLQKIFASVPGKSHDFGQAVETRAKKTTTSSAVITSPLSEIFSHSRDNISAL